MELRNCFTPKEVREALRTLPKTLKETYDRILDSVPKRSYVQAALQWIACSVRPLALGELAVAAIVDPTVAKPNYFENQLIGGGKTIRKMLSKLIDVQKTEYKYPWDFLPAEGTSTSFVDLLRDMERSIQHLGYPSHVVVFSHSSVRDYLLQQHNDADISWSFSFSEDMAHRFIAKSCLALFQNEPETAIVSNEAFCMGRKYLLNFYLARHWRTHAARLPDEEPGSMTYLLNEEPLAARLLLRAIDDYTHEEFGKVLGWESTQTEHPSPGQKLQYAACNGFSCIVDTILASNPDLDVDAATEYGSTALSFACEREHWQTANTLLERGADPNKHDGDAVPLLHASRHGADDIVRELISHGADVNVECNPGNGEDENTPLTAAIKAGHPSTTELLLIHKADPNLMSDIGTPISVAAQYGRHECMDLLWKHGASLIANDIDGPSLLEQAAASGSVETVKSLLTQGLDVNDQNRLKRLSEDLMLPANTYKLKYPVIEISPPPHRHSSGYYYSYGSPLHAAAAYGHTEVVKLLVENNAAVNKRSHYWDTPSTLARVRGHEATLAYLVSKGGVVSEPTGVCYRQDLFKASGNPNQGLRLGGIYKYEDDEDDGCKGDDALSDDDGLDGCSGQSKEQADR